ncbi:hypothetical protein SK128_005234, partial [Halocaridina rubra]
IVIQVSSAQPHELQAMYGNRFPYHDPELTEEEMAAKCQRLQEVLTQMNTHKSSAENAERVLGQKEGIIYESHIYGTGEIGVSSRERDPSFPLEENASIRNISKNVRKKREVAVHSLTKTLKTVGENGNIFTKRPLQQLQNKRRAFAKGTDGRVYDPTTSDTRVKVITGEICGYCKEVIFCGNNASGQVPFGTFCDSDSWCR